MFLRLVRLRARPNCGPQLVGLAREKFAQRPDIPGLRATYLATRLSDDHQELLVLSLWDSVEAFTALVGPDLEHPHLQPDEADLVSDSSVEYFEVAAQFDPFVS